VSDQAVQVTSDERERVRRPQLNGQVPSVSGRAALVTLAKRVPRLHLDLKRELRSVNDPAVPATSVERERVVLQELHGQLQLANLRAVEGISVEHRQAADPRA